MSSNAEIVLFVDDEPMILRSIERLFINSLHRIMTTDDVEEALCIVEREQVAVVVSDQRMPKMQGTELLEKVKRVSPPTVKILLTGYADLATAVRAINSGEVFRFISKPWDDDELSSLLEDALRRYALLRSFEGADEAMLLALAETIELKDPLTQGHCKRVAQYAFLLAESFNIPGDIARRIRAGAWLHDCGKIGVPESVLNHTGALDASGMELIRNHPQWGAEVVRLADMGPEIINIVFCHHERYDGTGYPRQLRGEDIPMEARIVAIADMYDALTSDRPYRQKRGHDEALRIIRQERGRALDPNLTEPFIELISTRTVLKQ
jgi:putative two-component system response regulator